MRAPHLSLALLTLLPLAPATQQPAAPAAAPLPPLVTTRESGPKLAAWPTFSGKEAETLAADVQRLRKAHTAEMERQAHDALIAAGAAAIPLLLPALDKEANEAARERVRLILIELIEPEHTRLLAKEFTSKLPAVRQFALLRAAAFPDEALRADAEAALAFTKPDPKKKTKPPPFAPDETYAAALCCASTGSIAGLAELHERACKQWMARRAELTTALVPARGKAATDFLAPFLKHEDRAKRVAAIEMLGACGTKDGAAPLLRPFLDEVDGGLKIAAINALRGIVDNAAPIDNLSIFEAVEEAKKWQKRL
jgi:hypothetical protein